MKLKTAGFLTFLSLLGGAALNAAVIYPIGQASTAGFSQGLVADQTPRGWDFTVNASNVSVVQLGVNAATSGSIVLTLWDDNTQAELAQITVNAVANSWVFGDLLSPVGLTNGQEYSVIGWADTTDGNPWYQYSSPPACRL